MLGAAFEVSSVGFAGERPDDGPACGRRGTGRSPANPREAALAADLITASKSLPGSLREQPTAFSSFFQGGCREAPLHGDNNL